MNASLDELLLKLKEGSDLEEDELRKRIEAKVDEFSGLISNEGAAHIVAKELGVNLLEQVNRSTGIENLTAGMRSATITAKVTGITDVRTFKRDDEEGRVVNLELTDETGSIRMSLWDEQVDMVQDGTIKKGLTLNIVNGYTKEDNRGNPELRVGKRGMIKKSDEELDVTVSDARSRGATRKPIREAKVGDNVEFRGALVRHFENKPFYFVCPECDNSIKEGKCDEHGSVVKKPVLMASGIIDDGTENMRAVFFRDAAEKVIGLSTDEAYKKSEEGTSPGAVHDAMGENLGREFIVKGYIKENDYFEQAEIIVNSIEEVEPLKEAKKLVQAIEAA